MQRDAIAPDLVAFNHYPHSERYRLHGRRQIGDVPAVYVAGEPPPAIGPLLRAAAERLRLPLAVGEVHVRAHERERVRWLAQHAADAWRYARTASTCARSARGRRSAWSTGTRCCAGTTACAKTASTRSPGRTGRREPTAVADALRVLAAARPHRRRRRPRLVGAPRPRARRCAELLRDARGRDSRRRTHPRRRAHGVRVSAAGGVRRRHCTCAGTVCGSVRITCSRGSRGALPVIVIEEPHAARAKTATRSAPRRTSP